MTDLLLTCITTPDEALASRIAAAAVDARLAACAQVSGPLRSTYRWEGAVEQATEWGCQLKTTRAALPGLTALIRALHPYDVPEIIAIPIVEGHAPYLAWITDATSGPT